MLQGLFGTKTAGLILLHLYHYGELHARGLSRDLEISLSSIQNQLKKFEDSGFVASKKIGNVRVYFFNKKSPLTRPLLDLIKVIHSAMSFEDKEKVFKTRKRPRRAGKPTIGRSEE